MPDMIPIRIFHPPGQKMELILPYKGEVGKMKVSLAKSHRQAIILFWR